MTRLTILNGMADADFETALNVHLDWALRDVDLKDSIFGKTVIQLSDFEAHRVRESVVSRGLEVYCLSSLLFGHAVDDGEGQFSQDLSDIGRLLEIAAILQPRVVRLLAPSLRQRDEISDSTAYIQAVHPWLIPIFSEAVAQIAYAGYQATIENECPLSIFRAGDDVLAFFDALDRGAEVVFTWDVQNMWQMGTYPSLEVYEQLKPVIGYVHLKGGQHDGTSTALRWGTSLEDASWPALDITRRVVSDGGCPVICLNTSHGEEKKGYDYASVSKRDIDFLRREVKGIE